MSGTAGYGYGICGHKNTYCCGVMNGNYVEDQYGRDLAKMTRGRRSSPNPPVKSRTSTPRTWSIGPATRTSSRRTPWMTSEVGCRAELLFSPDGDLPAREKAKLKPGPLKIGGTLPHLLQMREHAKGWRPPGLRPEACTEAVRAKKHALKPAFGIRVEDAEPRPSSTGASARVCSGVL